MLCFNLKKFIERPNSVLQRAYRFQLLAALSLNIIAFCHGVGVGWLSPTLVKLQSDDSPLSFPVNIEQSSWVGSMIGLGSAAGNLLAGLCLNRFGRKICLYAVAFPHLCLWILIYFAQSVEFLYVARFLGGVTSGGCFIIVPLFISEIGDPRIRGTLSSLMMIYFNFGVVTGYILSTHLPYHVVPIVIIALPIIYVLLALYFPETPQHLLRSGKFEAASKSFKFYKNCPKSGGNADEIAKVNSQFEELSLFVTKGQTQPKISYKDFVTKDALKAFASVLICMLGNQFCGSFAFTNYMTHIFSEAGATVDPNTCTIIGGVVQISACFSAMIFVDRVGRKALMLISSGGSSVSLMVLGCYTYFARQYDLTPYGWIPMVLIYMILYLFNIGLVSMMFVIIVEIFPAKIRAIATSGAMFTLSLLIFVSLKVFPVFMFTAGISITMWSCSAVSGLCFIYFFIFLVETKGKSMDSD